MILTENYRKEMEFIKKLAKKTMCMSTDSFERFCKALDDPLSMMDYNLRKYVLENSEEDLRIEIKNIDENKHINYNLEEEYNIVSDFINNIMFFLIADNILSNEPEASPKRLTTEEFIEGKYLSRGKNIYKIESFILKFIDKILPEKIKVGDYFIDKILFVLDSVRNYFIKNSSTIINLLSERSKLRKKVIDIAYEEEKFNFINTIIYNNNTDHKKEKFLNKKEDFIKILNAFFEVIGVLKIKKQVKVFQTYNMSDILLCSYGESWTSCLSIDSCYNDEGEENHTYGYWAGLFNVYMNPSHSMFYATDGSYKNYLGQIKTHSFIKRAWLIQTDAFDFSLVNMYPNGELQKTIYMPDNYKIIPRTDTFLDKIASYHSFNPLRMIDEYVIYIYKDEYALKSYSHNEYKTELGHSSGFSYFDGSDKEKKEDLLQECDSLTEMYESGKTIEYFCENMFYCCHCGAGFTDEESLTYLSRFDEYVCDSCLEDFAFCGECGTYVEGFEATYVESESMYVCDDCLNIYYYVCDDCNDLFHERNMVFDSDEKLCESCKQIREEEEEERKKNG